ncbi:MAG: hypothetical protein JW888_13465 [Pirellulales bacterium]|nr:hypothetical protein [Pirellulales bacterium]
MRKNLRAVAAALILATIGAGIGLAQMGGGGDNPFEAPPSTKRPKPSQPKVQKIHAAMARFDRNIFEQPATGIITRSEADARIHHALAQKTKMQFMENPLGEVADYLSHAHDIPIRLDKGALEELDLSSDTLITCTFENISLRNALELMLRDLELAYTVRNDVLLITTEEVAEANRKVGVYDVADLVTYRNEKGEIWTDYEPLAEMITATIAPDTWADYGGEATIEFGNFNTAKILIVKQTDNLHHEIAQLLDQIRRVAAQTPGDGLPPLKPHPTQPVFRGNPGPMGMGGTGSGGLGLGGTRPGVAPSGPTGGEPATQPRKMGTGGGSM